ncbi:hypothetical protein ACLCDV_10960 [Sphingobacterium sp. Lzh-3]|uniref:hypothetical protein n=1 Tax=Sphingobacterium sp. Lzh-3 TaxID=3382150 RepID=UPI00398D3D1C
MKVYLLLCSWLLFCLKIAFAQQQTTVVRIIEVDNSFDKESRLKLHAAAKEFEAILNSEAFAREVLHEKFNVGNNGLSSAEIYELIISGINDYKSNSKDYSIDLHLSVFDKYVGSRNFGKTDMNTRITSTHRCFILNNNVKCYTSHLAHEYMHQIGFYDKRKWLVGTKTQSVPYKIGNIINKLTGNLENCSAVKKNCSFNRSDNNKFE